MSRWPTLLLAIVLLLARSRSGQGAIRFDAPSSSWQITSGAVELDLHQDADSVYLAYLGTTNQPAWLPVSTTGGGSDQRRGETSGLAEGIRISPVLLKLGAHQIRSPKPGVDELTLSLEHRQLPLRLNVTYTAWADTGVLTRQLRLTNTGANPFELQSCPSLFWELPQGNYEASYFWSSSGGQRELKTERLSVGAREFGSPEVAPWLSVRDQRSGCLFVAQMAWSGDAQLRFQSFGSGGSSGKPGLEVQMGRPLRQAGLFKLAAGQSVELPMVAFTATRGDLDDAARAFHRYQRQFVLPNGQMSPFQVAFQGGPILSADSSPVQVRASLDLAAELGAEAYALDEGWETLIEDSTATAPFIATTQLLVKYLRAHGLKLMAPIDLFSFGPESGMVRTHPDWFVTAGNQAAGAKLLLDFRQPRVRQWAETVIQRVVREGGAEWIRLRSKQPLRLFVFPALQAPGALDEYLRGRSEWLAQIRTQHPAVLFEDAFSGPDGANLASIGQTHQTAFSGGGDSQQLASAIWRSTLAFPPEAGSYAIDVPSGDARSESALEQWVLGLALARNGSMLLQGLVGDWTPERRQRAKEQIAWAKRIRKTLGQSDVYHLSPQPGADHRVGWMGLQYITADRRRCVVLGYRLGDGKAQHRFPLRELAQDGSYELVQDGQTRGIMRAAELNYTGLSLTIDRPWGAAVCELTWVPAQPVIHIDGRQLGSVFEGVGALSAGGSSRLLRDYPEPVRSQILDLLFKPRFGAGFQHLKVEIGGDVNSTAGAEPSHMRTPLDTNSDRGYEWWLMREARSRNPHLPLDALEWGAPAWIGEFYSRENADYLVEYLRQAKELHGSDINYLGIRNEVRYDAGWIKLLRQTLDRRGFPDVKIVAPDEVNRWSIVPLMQTDPELARAVDVVGVHYPQFMSTAEAQGSGKRLWASEDGCWNSDWAGAKQLAKILNRNYIAGKMTKTIVWSLVAAYYDFLPNPSTGVIRANEPWSGHYRVQPSLWAIAHTTQFAEPGWIYVAPGCGYLPMEGSIVTLRSTNQTDFSMIAETVDATRKQQVAFQLEGGLATGALHVWRSSEQGQFERLPDLVGTNGLFSAWLEPGSIYSLTTTTGQTKGEFPIPPARPFPPQYVEDFETCSPGAAPRFFSDQGGAFEVALRADHTGHCLRQVITKKGIEWESHLTPLPETFLGDANWRDYNVGVDALLEGEGFVSLFGRVGQIPQGSGPPRGYWLKIADTGFWELGVEKHPIASGKVGFSTNRWHHLQLDFDRTTIEVRIDHAVVGSVPDETYVCGMVGVGSGWHGAQFDNLRIQEAPWDHNLAFGKPMLASSQADADSTASQANDGNAFSTRWTAAAGKTSGEWLEVDFGAPTAFDTVVLKPFVDQISQYSIQYWNGNAWLDAAVGQKLEAIATLIAFPTVTATKTRFYARQSTVPPSLWEFEVFDNSLGRARPTAVPHPSVP